MPETKWSVCVAEHALAVARRRLPAYSARHSPRRYTQYQLYAIAALRKFFRTDFRGIAAILEESSELRGVLGLERVPNYTTLFYAERRLGLSDQRG